jgi:hypothetical protein
VDTMKHQRTYDITGVLVAVLAFVFYLLGHINGYVAFLIVLSTCKLEWTTAIIERIKQRTREHRA